MSSLTIIAPETLRTSPWKSSAATLLRFGLVLLIAVAIRIGSDRRDANRSDQSVAIELSDVQILMPAATTLDPPSGGVQAIVNRNGEVLGYATLTWPAAASVVGYRGPSNVLLILDEQSTVFAAKLVNSDDTPEHVAAIQFDDKFLPQFIGWTMGQPDTFTDVDGTTGATLTSLAIAEGIAVRLGSDKPSLRFPDDLAREDLKLVFDDVTNLQIRPLSSVTADVVGAGDSVIGQLIRTGPLVDSIAGYQGPSELIVAINSDGTTSRLALRRTFDNQPYAGYLNEETYFWKVFQQKTIEQLRTLDLEAEQVEGVSGATMTSMAVAETVVAAAKAYTDRAAQKRSETERRRIHWSHHDTGTLAVVCCGLLIGTTRLRGRRWVKNVWNLTLVIYFGLVTGNLISQAVVMGWAANGMAWRLAPGLALVVLVSLVLPPLTRRNLYCSHLCPHGAAQQLLMHRCKTKWRLNHAWSRRLRWLPGVILVAATLATVTGRSWNLAAWEPFNAYVWYVAGMTSIALAIASLAVSTVVPMAYCQYACPTGRLLNYVRRSAAATRVTIADILAVMIAAFAWLWVLI